MTMPKGWKNLESKSVEQEPLKEVAEMPTVRYFSYPVVPINNLKKYRYQIKKIEIFEKDTLEYLHPKNLRYLEIPSNRNKLLAVFH